MTSGKSVAKSLILMMKPEISKWILYNIVICFAVYWLSNLILWYPWSVNETLGMALMLTINPLLWGYASYQCIVRYPKPSLFRGVLLNSGIFVTEAIASDLIFFIGIRNSMDKLLSPTTYYAWGFVLFFPFIIYFLFRKRIIRKKRQLVNADFWKPLIIGLISFVTITAILLLKINFH